MKLFAYPKYFADTTAPLVTVVRLLGLRAFEFRGRPRYTISFIYLLLLYILYCCSLHMRLAYYSNVNLLKLESALIKLLLYITSAFILVKLMLGWWYTKKYNICHQKITAIDETLRQLGLTVNYDRIYFKMIGVMALWIILVWCWWIATFSILQDDTSQTKTDYTSQLKRLFTVTMYTYGISINTIIFLEFYILVKCIRMKFESINQLLLENLEASMSTRDTKLGDSIIDDYAGIMNYGRQRHAFAENMLTCHRQKPNSRIISVIEKQNSIASRVQSAFQSEEEERDQQQEDCSAKTERRKCLLQIIRQVHLELCKISKTLCTIFGLQIVCVIGISITFFTGVSYIFYNLYVKQYKQYKPINHLTRQMIARTVLSILNVSKLILVSRACKTTADEGNKTIEIIRSIYGCNADADLTDEIQQFGNQILQNPTTFTAFGLPLNNTVLTMSLRFITTYVVIMIQVSNSLESDKTIQHL